MSDRYWKIRGGGHNTRYAAIDLTATYSSVFESEDYTVGLFALGFRGMRSHFFPLRPTRSWRRVRGGDWNTRYVEEHLQVNPGEDLKVMPETYTGGSDPTVGMRVFRPVFIERGRR